MMDARFWHDRWENKQIAFHEGEANGLLAAHAGFFSEGERVYVPLCGKTRDIAFFLDRRIEVVGVELSEIAVRELFDELGVDPDISAVGALKRYAAPGLEVYVGDFFALDAETLGHVSAVYDRAALVALPEDLRARYALHLAEVTAGVRQFLLTFAYDQNAMQGPPFSVTPAMVEGLYGDRFEVGEMAARQVVVKGTPATERAFGLMPR